jgi:hypothetical protein
VSNRRCPQDISKVVSMKRPSTHQAHTGLIASLVCTKHCATCGINVRNQSWPQSASLEKIKCQRTTLQAGKECTCYVHLKRTTFLALVQMAITNPCPQSRRSKPLPWQGQYPKDSIQRTVSKGHCAKTLHPTTTAALVVTASHALNQPQTLTLGPPGCLTCWKGFLCNLGC